MQLRTCCAGTAAAPFRHSQYETKKRFAVAGGTDDDMDREARSITTPVVVAVQPARIANTSALITAGEQQTRETPYHGRKMSSGGKMPQECKQPIRISNKEEWKAALATPRPGPQSDVASWFSTQWHVVEPSVATIAELNDALRELEGEDQATGEDKSQGGATGAPPCFIDAVVVSHEFTDHCHRATLEELPKVTPVLATDEAARLIGSWGHFDTVITTPPFSSASPPWKEALSACHPLLPPWLGVGRVVTPGNSLYYHSAIMIAFDAVDPQAPTSEDGEAETILYSPHGIEADDLAFLPSSGLKTLALLHGMHDVRIWMTKQLNLGAHNGLRSVRASGARYWIATHDEIKAGGGLISWLLRRTTYTLKDAVEAEEARLADADGEEAGGGYWFMELASGDAMVLE
ncbi:hypothetical protein MAPG_06270 [Magnaporthiopsis poae ATCC 64411]|uniref:Uncharacterized protein n=1 Tax=Magnaporthiopsis poae (strain ATCC 64411 / 73-15) TaxID=644358 RepID=A0A0C4E1K6_MAGP6|nr:hypothetical protein MAPG_06270 [Magnaporthiopsis poae ATCC 64411]